MKDTLHMNTMLIGLLGHPIKQTYSPFIYNMAFDINKLDFIYLPFDVPASNLRNAIKGIVALGMAGFNVTIPHKINIIQLLNNVSEEAAAVGAVNTVVNELGKLTGYNTDIHGVMKSLEKYKNFISGQEMTVLGAGGGARAVVYTLIRYFKPSKINLINRTEQKAEGLKTYFSEKMKFDDFKCYELFPPNLDEVIQTSKLIVNATSVGMFPESDDTIISLEKSFHKDQIVLDLIYNPTRTRFLSIAAKQGATIINGIPMLVYQASKSFELWTGETMPVESITRSLELFIGH